MMKNPDYDTGRAELKDLTHKGVFKVNQYFADQQNRFSWIAWNQDKTLTNKKNRKSDLHLDFLITKKSMRILATN